MAGIYDNRQQIKYIFTALALIFVGVSLYYSNSLVKVLEHEEKKKIELWAEATTQLASDEMVGDVAFILKVIEGNNTIPVVIMDTADVVLQYRNLSLGSAPSQSKIRQEALYLKKKGRMIPIEITPDNVQFLYYDDSFLIKQLAYYPYIQLSLIGFFLLIALFAVLSSKKAEQNQVWVGLSKETAHQLGTPISSLMAWTEIFKQGNIAPELILNMEKDVLRLKVIADRFSKIGSKPTPEPEDLNNVISGCVNYLGNRISQRVKITYRQPNQTYIVLLCVPLFEWVVENLCKNAVDAMDGSGKVDIGVSESSSHVLIDVKDSGKGIPKNRFKTVFSPGYTTKKRGWGLGLSLAKRIIEEYHEGRIYVRSSDPDKGTTFRIELKKV